MKKYKVLTEALSGTEYIIKANSKEEAEQKFYDCEWEEANERPDIIKESNEEVIGVEEIK